MSSGYAAAKRLTDVAASAAGLLLLAPLLAAMALAVVLEDGGPVLFRQERVGRGGRPFRICKFRTMRASPGRCITVGRDPRITRVGAWLRRTKLDELPQLWNVLVGDMSLVGPRPEVPAYVALYSPADREVLAVRPGLTDPASLRFRRESELLAAAPDPDVYYPTRVLPRKLALSRAYLREASWLGDLVLLLLTLGLGPATHPARALVTRDELDGGARA